MGTSASNGGPKGSPPLLPDWYNDGAPSPSPMPPDAPQPPPEGGQPVPAPPVAPVTKDWGNAKGALTRVSNGTGGSSARKAAGKYVSSLGGSAAAARAASMGIRVGGNYGAFLGSASSGGMTAALGELGLSEYIGRSSEEVCAAIANALAPIGSTNDEAIARDALITTLDSLYTKVLDAGGGLDTLENLTPEMVKETMIDYVSNYVFTKWMYELGSAIEKGNISEQDAISLEREVRDLIFVETTERYRDTAVEQLNFNDNNSIQVITEIFETAYSTLEQ